MNTAQNSSEEAISLYSWEPHKPVSSTTIARWLKVLCGRARVNMEIFKAHSIRSASTLVAAAASVTTSGYPKSSRLEQ